MIDPRHEIKRTWFDWTLASLYVGLCLWALIQWVSG